MTNIFLVVINGGSGEELCSCRGGWRSQLEGGPRAMEIRPGFHRKRPTCHRFPQGPISGLSPACPSATPLAALPPWGGRPIFPPCKPGTGVRSLCSDGTGAPSVANTPRPVFQSGCQPASFLFLQLWDAAGAAAALSRVEMAAVASPIWMAESQGSEPRLAAR